ncbi:RNA polymerase sigma factor [Sphaerisporangium album]|uniref:RNA polymerase sigma factor n=1 Tax=Sphaerisporangium album TaxID=509200 RepID=UPI0015F0E0E0|nr:sigma-70 family RNA polymerase sigma factor [Sphaerisporangium album]
MIRRDDPAALERLCREYGDHLYDYCQSLLDDDDALSATVGALHGAVAHTDRLYDATRLRAWMYALARAECQSRLAGVAHTGSYARQGRGGSPELGVEVLACLEPREREILDLTLRHGLKSDEVARVLDISVDAVESAARLGRKHAEQWLAAVVDARGATPRCPVLPGLVKSWAESPTRLLRAHITRHVRSCKECDGAKPGVTITALMTRMPILASPAPYERLFSGADTSFTAAETRTESWHPDGFPVQPDALEDPPPPEAPLTVEEGFTPERADGSKPAAPEFWEPDPDADDPESRIRWGRVGLVTLVSVASAGAIWSLVFAPGGTAPVDVEAAGGTIVVQPGESLPPLVESPPPPPPGSTAGPVHTTAVPTASGVARRPGVAQPTSSVPMVPPPSSSRPSASPTAKTRQSNPPVGNNDNAPNDPPPPPKQTSKPTQKPTSTPKQSSQPQTKQTTAPPPPPPPPPAPPAVTASTTSINVSTDRSGSLSMRSQHGAITWQAGGQMLSMSQASGTIPDGQTATLQFSIAAPNDPNTCGTEQTTTLSISWSGDNRGVKGSGNVGVKITYVKPCVVVR